MSEGWSGRRGSNPRPTAWKAVTLPLSYSRLRGARFAPRRYGAAGPRAPLSTTHSLLTAGKPAVFLTTNSLAPTVSAPLRSVSAARRNAKHCGKKNREGRPLPPTFFARLPRAPNLHARASRAGKVGGEGRVRTSVARWAADLQSAAIDRSATSPKYISCDFFEVPLPSTSLRQARRTLRSGHDCFGSQCLYPLRPWATALKPAHVMESARSMYP